jgi:hypothetical protein
MSDMSGMHGWVFFMLNMVATIGPLFVLLYWPMASSGGDPDRRKRSQPAPVSPTAPSPVEPALRPLPDCLIPRPAEHARELELI